MQQRLFEITHLLVQRGGTTAAYLAQRFGVSRRTIYRDIDALSGAGIPVYTEKGKGGGIRILPNFVLDKTMFSKAEQTQLVAHFQGLASIGTPETEAVLDKLGAIFGRGDSWLEVDFAPWDAGEDARGTFRLLREAILRRQAVHFEYNGSQGQSSAREVEPIKIMFRGQGWYVHAFCRKRQDYRFFKLSRIKSLQSTGETFAPHTGAPSPMSTVYTGGYEKITLRFAPEMAFRMYDEFPSGEIAPDGDGGFLVSCSFPTGNWLVGFILSFGVGAEVISPAHLRDEIALAARRLHALYSKED